MNTSQSYFGFVHEFRLPTSLVDIPKKFHSDIPKGIDAVLTDSKRWLEESYSRIQSKHLRRLVTKLASAVRYSFEIYEFTTIGMTNRCGIKCTDEIGKNLWFLPSDFDNPPSSIEFYKLFEFINWEGLESGGGLCAHGRGLPYDLQARAG